jgi:ElaB/YqjD/DUF883 family membrane-anchored ribosome-binding protein
MTTKAARFAAEAQSAVSDLAHEAREQMKRAGVEFGTLDKELRAFVEEQPLLTLLGAAAAGFVVARLLARR